MTKKTTLDLTNGPVLPLMLRFCLPILLGNLMQQFYNMVDSAVVGKFVGTGALAAVGATGALTFLIIGFVDGMCAGFCIPVAQAFGGGNKTMLRRCVMNIVYLGIFFAALLTVATSLSLRWMLTVMDFPADIFGDSLTYLRVLFLAIPVTILYNTSAALMRAMGNSRTPLLVLMMASGINIVLDLVFVCVFHLGVLGVALATMIAQTTSGVVCLLYILKNYPDLRSFEEPDEQKFNIHIAKRLVLSGLPMALQYSITAIGSILIQVSINNLGSLVVASVTAANKVQSFVHLPFTTLGVTISTWCGQNMGARNYRRITDGIRCGMMIAVVYSLVMGVAMFFGGEYVSLIFIDRSEPNLAEILGYVRRFLRGNCLFYIPLGTLTVCRFGLQGLEYGITAMFAGLFEMVARSVVALAFATVYGFDAIRFANPAAWIAACVLLIPACLVIFPKVKKQLNVQ